MKNEDMKKNTDWTMVFILVAFLFVISIGMGIAIYDGYSLETCDNYAGRISSFVASENGYTIELENGHTFFANIMLTEGYPEKDAPVYKCGKYTKIEVV